MLLELRKIKKYFPLPKSFLAKEKQFVKAVDGVDLSINEGENLGLVGESGSGKTTLGRIILKLYPVNGGSILLGGKCITHLSPREMRPLRSRMQMVFQDPYSSLDPRYTIRNILKEAANILGKRERLEEQMVQLLNEVGLAPDCLDRFPHEFSGGERQRIALARALIMNPKLLILDEAVSSLDVLIQEQLISLLKELQEKHQVTYLFISHNLRVVKKICQKVAVMYKGKIVEMGQVEEIFNNPLHPYTQRLLSAAIEYKSVEGVLPLSFNEDSRLIDKGNGHFVIN